MGIRNSSFLIAAVTSALIAFKRFSPAVAPHSSVFHVTIPVGQVALADIVNTTRHSASLVPFCDALASATAVPYASILSLSVTGLES